ncbi:DUF952 domain-containing protein [Heyndrickxia sp. MSNUG]|uniref:DUF952 domain-containing protein n=1 Tax=Heyndrickxia sp. MSNUG TaxID=3136677 RepID=UPI003C2CCF7F
MILHIISEDEWKRAQLQGAHTPSSLDDEGFIHCSTLEQVNWVANSFFTGLTDLMLLYIDAEKVKERVIYEDTANTGMLFPHIYGPLNLDAVIRAVAIKPSKDGSFELPLEINKG